MTKEPEDAKRIENNNKIELAQRELMPEKVRTRVSEEDLAIINNGKIQTKNNLWKIYLFMNDQDMILTKTITYLRLAYWGGLEGQNFGKEFDKAIAQEDLALKKLVKNKKTFSKEIKQK